MRPFDYSTTRMRSLFGDKLLENEPLARYTSARVGGPADVVLVADSRDDLVKMVNYLVKEDLPFVILGGGSNVLVSDAGLRAVVVLNRARQVRFDERTDPPSVCTDSGANLGGLARQAAVRGLGGLEWAAGIPGTVGGAVFGNAGAHGLDMAYNLIMAEILHLPSQGKSVHNQMLNTLRGSEVQVELSVEEWPVERFEFAYRSSLLKRQRQAALANTIVLSVCLRLERSTPQEVQAKIDAFASYRRRTQPPGASMGSMFKNPPGDYAGRLIDVAGLKGKQVGGAQISPLHGNFFVNTENATAADIYALIELARRTVHEKTGVQLELEIELLGEWEVGVWR